MTAIPDLLGARLEAPYSAPEMKAATNSASFQDGRIAPKA
jgi:hypothetical protein